MLKKRYRANKKISRFRKNIINTGRKCVRFCFSPANTGWVALALSAVIFAFLGGVAAVAKNIVFIQSDTAVRAAAIYSPFDRVLPWAVGGSSIGMIIRFFRRQYPTLKRIFDALASFIGLVLFFPLFLIIAFFVKVDSPGPVFFRQARVGKNGNLFHILKFRTMRHNAELETGPVWAQDNDPRITRLGNFLRKSHLDELPQLINVFSGHMSLIGPRPERPEMNDMIKQHVPHFDHRLAVKPGITGLAQVRYNYGASIKDAARKLKFDALYMKRMCWLLDFQILIWTMARVLDGEGAR